MKLKNRITASLLAGAAGDALGYAVEFLRRESILSHYGEGGIRRPDLKDGVAWFSDDTQMTLFTAAGLLTTLAKKGAGAAREDYKTMVEAAYQEWLLTQMMTEPAQLMTGYSWLAELPGLYSRRAPGGTCLSALEYRSPIQGSKGCGGVMRVAPAGLLFAGVKPPEEIALIAGDAAGLTHGHPMGYIPAALLGWMVCRLATEEKGDVRAIAMEGLDAMEKLYPSEREQQALPEFRQMMMDALHYAAGDLPAEEAIPLIGQGWVGDEALAIAVYCAAKYPDDMEKALIASVNHDGDSDSTGAILGNLLGARLGMEGTPEVMLQGLEMRPELEQVAEDIWMGREMLLGRMSGGEWKKRYEIGVGG